MSDQVEARIGPKEYEIDAAGVVNMPTFPSDFAMVGVNGEQVSIVFALRADGLGEESGDVGKAYPKAAVYMSLDQAKGLMESLQRGVTLGLEQRKKRIDGTS